MFCEPNKRGKTRTAHDPFEAIAAPRPIGWITSMSLKGQVNFAQYGGGEADRPVRLRPVCRAGKHLCGAATAQHAQRATNWPFVPLTIM
jgi:hypothetical protein